MRQHNPATPGQKDKSPLVIPVATGLLVDGTPIPLDSGTTRILELTDRDRLLRSIMASKPVLSLLRGFSAPVRMVTAQSEADLLVLMGNDDDPFVAWDAAQNLLARLIEPALRQRRCHS